MSTLDRSFGRNAFGDDPGNYHAARPPYPRRVWEVLERQAGLAAGISILEIGAGTGLATRELVAHRPARLVAIEPDARLAAFLRASLDSPALEVMAAPFEDTVLPDGSFDLVACATAFHWLDAVPALRRINGLLRPGGAVALWWHVFGDASRPDPFHDASAPLFARTPPSPAAGPGGVLPPALDVADRLQDFAAAGFVPDAPEIIRWTLALDPPRLRALYSTFSNVTVLPAAERERLLDDLAQLAATRFAGQVERNMTTAVYVARKPQAQAAL